MSKNNHMIVPVLRNLMEHRLFGIKSLFQLLTDEDIMNIACSCKALYRYIDKINKSDIFSFRFQAGPALETEGDRPLHLA